MYDACDRDDRFRSKNAIPDAEPDAPAGTAAARRSFAGGGVRHCTRPHRVRRRVKPVKSTANGGDAMSLEDRVRTLREKHRDLERILEEEENRPLPDNIVIHDLKRQKLAIKDEIVRLTHP